jgi:hypothetical protein
MNIKELLNDWESHSYGEKTTHRISVNLPLNQFARILALVDLFPDRTREQIITDLLKVTLDELEEAMPYVKGDKVIAEDEFGDPVYEDAGLTPRFLDLTQKHLKQLQSQDK